MLPSLDDVRAAAARIAPYAHRTPVLTSRLTDARAGMRLFFKCENFQRAGAFKFRGACNAVFSLDDKQAAAGVATHSSGNHAAALALAASLRGIAARLVMPRNAVEVKRQAVVGYGGEVVACEPTLASRAETLADVVARTGASVVHPYDDPRTIAGQGTAALELLAEVTDLDAVVAPVGGGGLMAGTCLAAVGAKVAAYGVEPEAADDALRSLREGAIQSAGNPVTIADGLRTSLGELPFAILRRDLTEIVTVGEHEIIAATHWLWSRLKILVEPSGAVPLAAVLSGKLPQLAGKRVGLILSGGNVDLSTLPWAS